MAQPTWTTVESWAEANQTLDLLCRKYHPELHRARETARRIETALETLHPFLEILCDLTCPTCDDSCCVRAKVWLGFTDLLFLHLTGLAIPVHQLRRDLKEPCRYLGERGCSLDRICRPWTCSFYLCPAQTNLLRKLPVAEQVEFNEAVKVVKEGRKRMEEEFMGVVM